MLKAKTKIRGLRWYIVIMLGIASELNYLDRLTLAVLAQTLELELNITTAQYANITSAFLVSYTVMYAVSGRLVDWLGTRKSFSIFVSGWSIATMLHFFAHTPFQFSVCRFLLGATEPANFPGGVKGVSEWFPMRERALAVGIFNAGTAVGSALAAPTVAWIALTWGWRYAFIVVGGLGLIWVFFWLLLYRRPQEHPRITDEEKNYIFEGQPVQAATPTVPWSQIFRTRAVWGCVAARMLTDPISYLFAFWTPKYLQQTQGFNLADVGKYSWIPFAALAVGNILGGLIPNRLVRRGWSLNRSRKTVMFVASCMTPVCCLIIVTTNVPALAVGMISVAMLAHALWANMTLPAEVLPRGMIGSVTGLAGALGGIIGIISQQLIGWTVQNVSYTPVFAVCAFMPMLALGAVHLLIRTIGQPGESTQLRAV
ncbi:MFS transporter [Nibricoccus aquaticus]|uniref:MFS transporter n=1 Tax=Nibricoccus aquaticus TaxID=2576891 RepID=A0A290QAS8_9BACT|nr:MFS transporter [Nibricoccus aquaticus]ATC65543.1 MFS transporter [Nibricoccus aquaticus]